MVKLSMGRGERVGRPCGEEDRCSEYLEDLLLSKNFPLILFMTEK